MHWVAYLEILGLYAAAHRPASGRAELPLVVLDGAAARDGCPRAFAQGLRLGMPRQQVQRQVPGALLADFGTADYGPLTVALRDLCALHSPRVEPAAHHRVFVALPVPGSRPPAGELSRLVERADRTLAAVAGLPAEKPGVLVRAGLAANKLVARAAAESAAPGAAPVAVPAGAEAGFLAPLPVAALWPAPPDLLRRLTQLGLTRVADLAGVPEAELQRQFGAAGQQLARWARGLDPDHVRAAWPPRDVGWRAHFPAAAGAAELPPVAARAARELSRRLQDRDEVCQALRLALDLEPGSGPAGLQARKVLARRQQGAAALAGALLSLLQQVIQQAGPGARYTALAAAAEDLAPAAHRQLDIWGAEVRREEERAERLAQALAAVSARFPDRTAQVGWPAVTTRREAMLRFYDPLLAAEEGRGPQADRGWRQ